jgi:hypothetical protein
MTILTVECLCGNSFVVTDKILEEAFRHPAAPFIICNQLVGTGMNSTICNRPYSAVELKKWFGKTDILVVKDEMDMQLAIPLEKVVNSGKS